MQLPVKAVHGMAAQLQVAGAVRLPAWLIPPMGPLAPAELTSAARALQLALRAAETSSVVLGRGPDAFHNALRSLSEVGAACYCDASRAVAACAECATRMLGLLADAQVPGWTSAAAEASGPRAWAVRVGRGQAPQSDVALLEAEGRALHCLFSLEGTVDVEHKGTSSSQSLRMEVGDAILVAGARAKLQVTASTRALHLEVCAQ